MPQAIKLSDQLIEDARINGKAQQQIEYWAKIGEIADENPDLPLSFIKGTLNRKEIEAERFLSINSGENSTVKISNVI